MACVPNITCMFLCCYRLKAGSLEFYVPPADSNCTGSWSSWSSCNATACGQTGHQTSTYNVITAATGNGTACPVEDGAEEFRICSADPCADVDCVGRCVECIEVVDSCTTCCNISGHFKQLCTTMLCTTMLHTARICLLLLSEDDHSVSRAQQLLVGIRAE